MGNPGAVPQQATDAELISRWQRGDDRAATMLVERHSQPLARFAASLGEREGIEELVQDTFVRAFNSLDTFRSDSSLRTWLFTICKRLILDRKRSERRRRDGTELEEGHAVQEYGALDTLLADETATKVSEAVARLSPLQREVFLLRVADGMPYGEIAKVVDSTEGACRVHYHNALRTIKEYLGDD